jgi:UDP-N-acetylmuramoyl-tripeptide--D-alanyl-D-alanine ligase
LAQALAQKTQAQVLFYGLDPRADLWADQIESLGVEGIHFRLHYHNETVYVRVPLIGRHSVHIILRTAAVGLAEGLTWQEIIDGLHGGQPQLRLVAAHTAQGAVILGDTYEANPESTMAALNLLDQMSGRKIAVLGDMLISGASEIQSNFIVGGRVAEVCSLLVTVGEGGKAIAEAASTAGMRPWAVLSLKDNQAVVDHLNKILLKGDVVLVKGSYRLHMDRIINELEVES